MKNDKQRQKAKKNYSISAAYNETLFVNALDFKCHRLHASV